MDPNFALALRHVDSLPMTRSGPVGILCPMRPLARYSLTGAVGNGSNPQSLPELTARLEEWLRAKGWDGQAPEFPLADGRVARVKLSATRAAIGQFVDWRIAEPTTDGRTQFQTQLILGRQRDQLVVYCELSATLIGEALAPGFADARCPTFIRNIIDQDSQWFYGPSHASADVLVARGEEQGEFLVRVLVDRNRRLPVIVVSSHHGLTLQAGLAAGVAADLAGLATVVETDDAAAWRALNMMGGEWSCRGGAIRLYWPLPIPGSDPRQHPLWTPSRLLREAPSIEQAAQGLRNYLRRRLMGVSVFAVSEPTQIADIRQEAAAESERAELEAASETNEWEALARQFQQERDQWRAAADATKAQNDELREKVYYLQTQTTFAGIEADDALPPDAVPATIAQAVSQARLELTGKVVFGKQVDDGVADLRPDAGPPEKVLEYLRALGLMVEEVRKGPLGNSHLGWLDDIGVTGSHESETIRNSPSRMKKRRWHDGVKLREFDLHLKPNEALPPDRCVRIYFDWDDATKQIVVGWIGRHPD